MTDEFGQSDSRPDEILSNPDCAQVPLGIPTDLFTPIFAIARTSGWTAHVLEQLADNRLIRPSGVYDGPDDLKYQPISKR